MFLEGPPKPFPLWQECGACLQSIRMSGRGVIGSLAPTSPPRSAEEAPSLPTCSPSWSPPPVTVLGQKDSDLQGGLPETTANQGSLLGVCKCSPGFAGRQGGPRAGTC